MSDEHPTPANLREAGTTAAQHGLSSPGLLHLSGMTKPKPQTCEVKIDGEWRAVSLTEAAVDHVVAVKRCPACRGQVMILGAYSGANVRRTMSHRKSHSGCPLKPNTYSGTLSLYPQALS
ncbi:hypothetical protein [Methylobacterium sp. E-046]|uniref:hypothetical protein n=1 Tax=Methylobacterium sp. E-046 TaxID=2836576 RepID=UPI001FB942C9|nr:hypothetical protein [Methylobacterium sp. E-046]MCJ2099682.1 hypothetical protein [Methylobacterium sp. E-046]